MRKAILLLFFSVSFTFAQQKFIISGVVRQSDNQKPIAGASVLIAENGMGFITDSTGTFELKLNRGSFLIEVSHQSFFKKYLRVDVKQNQEINFILDEKVNELEEVKISANSSDQNMKRLETGVTNISIKAVKKLPTLLGELDIIKSLFTLPGVTSVGEGSSGFNVRGGNVDQNLILLDDAPIFNSSHLMGFFSVFNPDALRDVNFYRGGIPAQYGGRTASVLNINLKDANAQKLTAMGGVGTISSRLVLEAPIFKDKASVYVAGRLSYVDQMARLINVKQLKDTKANFYDITAKMEFRPSAKDRISLTAFTGHDVFKLGRDTLSSIDVNSSAQFNWQSSTATVAWSHFFNNKFSLKTSASMSQYDASVSNSDSATAFNLKYGIDYRSIKSIFNLNLGQKNKIDFGYQINYYQIQPGELTPTTQYSNKNYLKLPSEQALESAVFINDEIQLTPKLSVGVGVRYALFSNIGEGYVYEYEAGVPREKNTKIDSTFYSRGQTTKRYSGFEPRLGLNLALNDNTTVKLSYNRMQQFIQLLSGTTAALPTDRWKLSDTYVKPQIADQISLGIYKNFKDNTIESSVEVFYKTLKNVVDFKDGSTLLLNEYPETAILQGTGLAYGAELYLKKTLGVLTGWLSYTYSQTRFLIDGPTLDEKINNGRYFQPIYNRPHIFNAIATYQLTRRVSFSSNFTYSSGRAITYPASKVIISNQILPYYNSRNDGQIPDYVRFDFSMNVETHPFRTEGYRSFWNLSFYNVFGRRNAYSVFFRARTQYQQFSSFVRIYKLSIIGSIIPSLTYNFRF
ncbi:MAG: TonB-dependent receptor [Spirosomaceae bacterium]|nr:TonB-dependent receptor [Spirosomataceae bacterium]